VRREAEGKCPRRTNGRSKPAGLTRRADSDSWVGAMLSETAASLPCLAVSARSRGAENRWRMRGAVRRSTRHGSRRGVSWTRQLHWFKTSPLCDGGSSSRRPTRKASRSWMNRELRPHGLRDGSLGSIFFRRPEDPPLTVGSVPNSIVETRRSERLCDGGAEICRSGRASRFCALCRVKEKTPARRQTGLGMV
jgi:hypothetical protein